MRFSNCAGQCNFKLSTRTVQCVQLCTTVQSEEYGAGGGKIGNVSQLWDSHLTTCRTSDWRLETVFSYFIFHYFSFLILFILSSDGTERD